MPKVFHVNWYQSSEDGKVLWPGYGDNIRVLEWIFKRVKEQASEVTATPLGVLPKEINLSVSVEGERRQWAQGLNVDWPRLIAFDAGFWKAEVGEWEAFLDTELGAGMPSALKQELALLRAALA